jgi:integrase
MTARRHFGSVRKLPSGRYQAGYWHDGTRHTAPETFTAKADARAWLSVVEADIRRDVWLDPRAGQTTVAGWLAWWLDTVAAARAGSELTRLKYEQMIRLHISPAIGSTPLSDLTAEQVDGLLAAKAGLAKTYVGRIRSTLIDALDHAQRRGKVAHNVARLSIMPKCRDKVERRPMTADQARSFLAAANGERLEALFALTFEVGLRPGEMTGPLWADLDLDGSPATLTMSGSMKRQPKPSGGYVMVRGQMKRSTNPNRVVSLSPAAVAALRAHKARQAAEKLAARTWQDSGLVSTTETGGPIDSSNLRRVFAWDVRRAGLDGVFPLPGPTHDGVVADRRRGDGRGGRRPVRRQRPHHPPALPAQSSAGFDGRNAHGGPAGGRRRRSFAHAARTPPDPGCR